MRIAFDENMPRAIVRALQPLVSAESLVAAERIEVCHALDLADRGTSDVPLIFRVAEGAIGKAALVTADRALRTRQHGRRAFREAGIIGIVLARGWNQESMWNRARLVLAWWPTWVGSIAAAEPGTMGECPYAWRPRRLKPIG